MPDIEINGKKFTCKEWTVSDLLEFNELQSKLDGLTSNPANFRGGKQAEALREMIAYISRQLSIREDEILNWKQGVLAEAMAAIIQANTTLPKVPAAVAPSQSSQASSTPAI